MELRVNYEEFPAAVTTIRNTANAINNNLTDAYKAMQDCHSVWTGKRYKDLATKFNSIVANVNSMLDLIVGDIPYTIEQIYFNYEAADKQTDARKAAKNQPKKVSMAIPADEMLYINGQAVTPYKTSVKNNFTNAKNGIATIKTKVDGLTWQGTSCNEYKAKLTKLKGDLDKAFDEISQAFDKLSTEAVAAFEAAEKANNVAATAK